MSNLPDDVTYAMLDEHNGDNHCEDCGGRLRGGRRTCTCDGEDPDLDYKARREQDAVEAEAVAAHEAKEEEAFPVDETDDEGIPADGACVDVGRFWDSD